MVEKITEPLARLCYYQDPKTKVWKPFDATITLPVGLVSLFSVVDCGGTNVAYSDVFYIAQCGYFGVWLQCASAGVVAVSITFQQGFNAAHLVAPEGAGTLLAIADTNMHVISVAPTPMPYIRFVATGTGANNASTTITGYFFAQ